ncbi:MAG: TPM domain-containing protein [Muribaculaceae bacterium]|nr:TPM domain-containing protein [Muribaculaceae bacterium]
MQYRLNILSSVKDGADVWRGFRRIGLIVLLAMISGFAGVSAKEVYYPERPNLTDANNYISDTNHYLPPAATGEINAQIAELRRKTTCEMAICIIKSLDGESIEDYSYNLFKRWGIGKSDKNNGVLIVMAYDDHRVRIEVGSGAEGVLTDVACANIIRNDIRPAMVAGDNIAQALSAATSTIYAAMTNPEVADELRSNEGETVSGMFKALDKRVIWQFVQLVAFVVFLITLTLFIMDVVENRKKDKHHRALQWRNHLVTFWWSVLFSMGFTLPIALVATWLYKRTRNRPETCPTCGGKMHKLSEEHDNALLSLSQDFEEQLGTVDYDVWVCDECGTIERFPYVEKQTKYTQCPVCGTVAMKMTCDKILRRPTTRTVGEGVRTYECLFCHHREEHPYEIPKETDSSALAAGAVAGSILGSRGHGGGGGFGGGSFGGGISSGGGASGGW